MINPARYDKLTADEKKAVDAVSGEVAARIFGKGWDRVDAIATDNMKKNGVSIAPASPALISEVKIRVNKLERDWAAAAEAKGTEERERRALASSARKSPKLKISLQRARLRAGNANRNGVGPAVPAPAPLYALATGVAPWELNLEKIH